MRLPTSKLSTPQIGMILFAVLLVLVLVKPGRIQAQRNAPPPTASVGSGSPLPVYMVNEPPPVLPEGFLPGSAWKFTTWTTPSTLSFTATVQKTEGGWAFLTVNSDAPATRWYYIPLMPGGWEQQQ
jgi:hypothetical protein